MGLEDKLASIKHDATKKINGTVVARMDDDCFSIDDQEMTMEQAIRHLSTSKPEFNNVAHLMMKGSKVISTHRLHTRKEYNDLLKLARSKKNYLMIADVIERDGKWYAKQPYILDWDSLEPEKSESELTCPHCGMVATSSSGLTLHVRSQHTTYEEEDEPSDELKCPYCKKRASSTSGLTLHIKSKHPEHRR